MWERVKGSRGEKGVKYKEEEHMERRMKVDGKNRVKVRGEVRGESERK